MMATRWKQHLRVSLLKSDAGGTLPAEAHSPSSLRSSFLVFDHLSHCCSPREATEFCSLAPGPLDSSVLPVHLCSPSVPAWSLFGDFKRQLNSMKGRREAGKKDVSPGQAGREGLP